MVMAMMDDVVGEHMKVLPGVSLDEVRAVRSPARRRTLTVDQYIQGVLAHDRTVLGLAFSLMESTSPRHRETSRLVLEALLPRSGKSIRLGVTGTPGAGKSTFVEALGMKLVEAGHKVAVLAVDPSSEVTGGSILGDKTRMENLSRHPAAMVRPSPSGTWHGGVARATRESIVVCEAAGYDVVIVETVGVGQSETQVASMVDFFLVLMIAGGGDELQGMKRGILELAHAVAVNKADGDNLNRAKVARSQLEGVLHVLRGEADGWRPGVYTCSAMTGEGITEIWDFVKRRHAQLKAANMLDESRNQQSLYWLRQNVEYLLAKRFDEHPMVRARMKQVQDAVHDGTLSPFTAAERLVDLVFGKESHNEGQHP
jgi:LAO/AO transport system kinase